MTPPPRIAISTSVIQRGRSGVGQYVLALVRALLDLPEAPRLVLPVLEDDLPLFDFAKERTQLVPVPERFRPALRNVLWHHLRLPRLLRKHKLDVLHVPSYRRMIAFAPCARVATIHDLAPFHVRSKYDPARMFYGRVVARRLARTQDEIIAVSSHTAGDIERFFGIARARQHVILNGLDTVRFRPGDPLQARSLAATRWDLQAPFFLYLSRLEHPGKNHVRLIEAFNELKARHPSPWQLALGGAEWHGAETIRAAAAASRFAPDIRFLGFVEDPMLPVLYRAAGAMVYPSLFEGFGMPPVEAMACGCPVLSSTRGALAEVVGDAAEPVDPESVPSLTAGLHRLATDEACRGALREAGYRNARRFDWSQTARNVLTVYRRAWAHRTNRD